MISLDRREWEPHVYCLGSHGHFVAELAAAQVPVTCLNARGLFSSPRVLFRLTRELRAWRPTIVQTFLFHANMLGRIAARCAGVPVVVSGLRVAERRSPWYGRLDRWTNGLVATNVCVSRGVAEFSERTVGLDPEKSVVIPNAVNIERFSDAVPANLENVGIPKGSRVFISIGRLEQQKGFDVLLDAIPLIDSLPKDVHFLIVGEGCDANRLRAHVERNQLTRIVHFLSRRNDIPELLAASIGLILPSRWEGMPNVVLEAMAAGRTVVATNVEGISELVQDGVTGWIVPPDQPKPLAEAIQRLLRDENFRIKAGELAQRIVAESFMPSAVTVAYVNLYRDLIAALVH